MKTFTIVDPGSGYQLHKAGCAHLKRPSMRADIVETIHAASVDDALDRYFDAELREMGWSPDDCDVYPCTNH